MPTIVTFLFRLSAKSTYSIETLFNFIQANVKNSNRIEVPNYSTSIRNVLANIHYAKKNQTVINHVVGDTYYLMLGLSKQHLNIVTIHDFVLLDKMSKNNIKYYFFKWLWFDLPVRYADVVTVISQKTYKDLICYTNCAASKVRVIPNFVNPLFKPMLKTFNKSCPTILHIGSSPNKNLLRLIEAIKGIDCLLSIIGHPTANEIFLLEKYKINFSIKNQLTQAEVITQYEDTDILVFVSTYEGFGLPIIEAQAVGRVVITSNIEPMLEVAGEGASFVDPYSVKDIHDRIQYIISDETHRNKLINAGFENVKKYQYDVVLNMYKSIYDLAANTKK